MPVFMFMSFASYAAQLLTCILAVVLFQRVAFLNVATDASILLASIVFAALHLSLSPWLALGLACIATALLNVLLLHVVDKLRCSDVLLTLGFHYIIIGAASTTCQVVFGTSSMGLLPAGGIKGWAGLLILVSVSGIVLLGLELWQPLKGAGFIGLSRELAESEGINIPSWRLVHALVGGVLLGAVGVVLTVLGGAFTRGITGQVGFLALLAVATAWPRPYLAFWCVPIFAAGFACRPILGEFTWLAEVLPFAVLLALQAYQAWRTGARWPEGEGSEYSTMEMSDDG